MPGKIKGPIKIHMGGKTLAEVGQLMSVDAKHSVKLPFTATGWKSSKMPLGITKKDIESGRVDLKTKKEGIVEKIKRRTKLGRKNILELKEIKEGE